MPVSQESVVNILIEGLSDWLTQQLLDTRTDEATAGLIRPGLLQDDPTDARINILIHTGGRKHPDVIKSLTPDDVQFEIQGAVFFKRSFVVELKMFLFDSPSRDYARRIAHVVLSRATYAIFNMPLAPLPRDSFNEKAYAVQVCESYLEEGGGEGDYNWQGNLIVEFFTTLEYGREQSYC